MVLISCFLKKHTITSRAKFEPQTKMKLESMVFTNSDPVLAMACLDQVCVHVKIVCVCVYVSGSAFGLNITDFIP